MCLRSADEFNGERKNTQEDNFKRDSPHQILHSQQENINITTFSAIDSPEKHHDIEVKHRLKKGADRRSTTAICIKLDLKKYSFSELDTFQALRYILRGVGRSYLVELIAPPFGNFGAYGQIRMHHLPGISK